MLIFLIYFVFFTLFLYYTTQSNKYTRETHNKTSKLFTHTVAIQQPSVVK